MSVWNSVRLSQRFAALPKAFYTSIRPQLLENVRWDVECPFGTRVWLARSAEF